MVTENKAVADAGDMNNWVASHAATYRQPDAAELEAERLKQLAATMATAVGTDFRCLRNAEGKWQGEVSFSFETEEQAAAFWRLAERVVFRGMFVQAVRAAEARDG